MANYMSQVAKMLGVELGEEFETCDLNGVKSVVKLTDAGIVFISHIGTLKSNGKDICLSGLLTGKFPIRRKPWKPKNDEKYYYVNCKGESRCTKWEDDFSGDIVYYKLGNCYRTEEEAEANRDKWIAFYTSDEVVEV